jgi:hypothetical protein
LLKRPLQKATRLSAEDELGVFKLAYASISLHVRDMNRSVFSKFHHSTILIERP